MSVSESTGTREYARGYKDGVSEIERLRAALNDAIDFIDPDRIPAKPFTNREMAHQLGLRLNQRLTNKGE